jgi:hypothetical protein
MCFLASGRAPASSVTPVAERRGSPVDREQEAERGTVPSKKVFDQQHHARPLGRLRPSRRGATRRAVLVAGATLTAAPFLVTTLASGAGASTPGSGARAATMVRVEPASRPLAGSRALGAVAASAAEKGAVVLEPRDTGAL